MEIGSEQLKEREPQGQTERERRKRRVWGGSQYPRVEQADNVSSAESV